MGLYKNAESGVIRTKYFHIVHSDTFRYLDDIVIFNLELGSLTILDTFRRFKLIPSWLVVFGFVGYSFLSIDSFIDFVKSEEGELYALSIYLMLPAGLFEITFALWLILRGFPEDRNEMVNIEERNDTLVL